MPGSCRVALLFDLDRADRETAELIRGVRRFAGQAVHWRCVVLPHLPRGLRLGYDGVIARADRRLAERCRAAGVAYVAVSQTSILEPIARVVPNWEAAGRLAARHVNDRGYETLGCIGFPRDPHSRLQAQGFRSARRVPRGYTLIIPRTFYQRTAWRWERFRDRFRRWLALLPKPAAVFTVRDVLARYLADVALDVGLRIPDELGIIGSGNDPALCHFPAPALTSIDFGYGQVGYGAAVVLERLMAGQPRPAGRLYVEPRLVRRHSTDRSWRFDALVASAVRWIAEHCHQPIRVGHVAAAVGLGERELRRRCRAFRNRSIVQEIARARIERAQGLLASGESSLDEVARGAGFSSARYMAQVFRRHEGHAPREYRKKRR